jgi:23S rRNA (pseudouridine1915-N3)-methyltransferase
MQWRLLTVGKPSLNWAREGLADYLQRLQRHTRIEHHVVREGPAAQVERQLLKASEGCRRILLDERGTLRRSEPLAALVSEWQLSGVKNLCLIIGGADGHGPQLRQAADELWSLSPMTLQHEMAAIVLIEQLYRAYGILSGSPYHRP